MNPPVESEPRRVPSTLGGAVYLVVVAVLRDVEGKSYEEIARILETSEGTVKSRISRARGCLRDKLKAYL